MSDLPKWRSDFPIEWGADNYVTRREFAKYLALVSGATFLGNGYFVLRRRETASSRWPAVAVAAADEIPIGGVKQFRYPTPDEPALLIRLAEEEYVAYKQRCTHLSCPVHFAPQERRLICPCHNGAFDAATGAVLQGPPPRPLPKIALRIADGQILAEGIEE
jgi:Rieske Fe-S protein